MSTKLTLTVNKAVIDKAKQYAKSEGRSLSALVESYLDSISKDLSIDRISNSPITASLLGSFKQKEDFDYKKELSEELSKKHLH